MPRSASAALALLCAALVSAAANAQSPREYPGGSPLLTTNPIFHASLQRIAAGSVLWRNALASVAKNGRHAIVLTPDQVVVAVAGKPDSTATFDSDVLAEVAPIVREESRIDAVLVVVNLSLVEETYRRNLSTPIDFERDIDRILVHEIYGHALPYLLAGDLSGRCPDPKPYERASEACSIKRENAVRSELGLGRRTDYGLSGLAMARPGRR